MRSHVVDARRAPSASLDMSVERRHNEVSRNDQRPENRAPVMDQSHPPAPAADPVAEPLFTPAEVREFDADDVEAGKNLCKMLSLFFFYTVIVMGLSTYITYQWVVNP